MSDHQRFRFSGFPHIPPIYLAKKPLIARIGTVATPGVVSHIYPKPNQIMILIVSVVKHGKSLNHFEQKL